LGPIERAFHKAASFDSNRSLPSWAAMLKSGFKRIGVKEDSGCVGGCLYRSLKAVLEFSESQEPQRTGRLARLVESRKFNIMCALFVATNCAFLIYASDYEMDQYQANLFSSNSVLRSIEIGFMSFYTIELVLRLIVHGMYFFQCPDAAWNMLDFCLVCVGLLDVAASALSNGTGPNLNPSFMRMLRLFRVVKVLRVVRTIRFLSELRLMFQCLLGSMLSLTWSLLMILLIVYMFALLLVQGLIQELRGQDLLPEDQALRPDQKDILLADFGSVADAMLVLIQVTTEGREWGTVFEVLQPLGGYIPWVLVVFIIFFNLAVWNIVTSMFVEKAIKLAKPDIDDACLEQHIEDAQDADELTKIFTALDTDNSGTMSLHELQGLLVHPKFRDYLRVRGIRIEDAELFHRMLLSACNDSGEDVHISLVVAACLRMKGLASSMDLHALSFEAKLMSRKQRQLLVDCCTRLQRLEGVISDAMVAQQSGPVQRASRTADDPCSSAETHGHDASASSPLHIRNL